MTAYRRKYHPEEVRVVVIGETDRALTPTLRHGLQRYSEAYGFSLHICANEDDIRDAPRRTLNHLIYLASTPYDPQRVTYLASYLEEFNSISIAFAYDSQDAMERAGHDIQEVKQRWQDRINVLRPDHIARGRYEVSAQKILDNAVCDTVRVKYQPRQIAGDVPRGLCAAVRPFFLAASEAYRCYALYHRSSYDGYFAIRFGEGFAITATKTNKSACVDDRIVFVQAYDAASNVLHYAGEFLPSSDAVEASYVFTGHPEVQSIVHTHASARFTRHEHYAHRRLVPPLPYGEAATGRQLAAALRQTVDGFVILQEHGEVFTNVPSRFATAVENVLWHCQHPQ
jgi:hypothetical protein